METNWDLSFQSSHRFGPNGRESGENLDGPGAPRRLEKQMDWTSIIRTLGSVGFIGAALAYLVPKLFDQVLSRGLEKFKIELQARYNTEIERLRAELRIAAFERETRFARLHEHRGRVIAELYGRLAKMHATLADYLGPLQVGGEQDHRERGNKAAECHNELFEYFNENRIYFEESFCSEMDKLDEKIRRAWVEFHAHPPEQRHGRVWIEVWKQFQDDVPPLRRQIEQTLRGMLGVENGRYLGNGRDDKGN